MNPPFKPKGEKSEWRMIYDALLAEAAPGQVITYAELDGAIGRDFRSNRSPIYRAREDLGTIRKRWLEPMPGVGYRVTEPTDHTRLSISHRRRSRQQVIRAVRVLEATDLERLPADALSQFDNEQKIAFALWAVIAHENRLRRIEDVLRREGML